MDQFELLRTAAGIFDRLGIRYFVTGSLASSFYGEYRSTHDIDIVADVHLPDIQALCASFPPPDFYVSEDAIRDAIARNVMFNILHIPTASKIDVIVQDRSPFDRLRFARARSEEMASGVRIVLASPEDVILKKLIFYQQGGSDKHMRDIAGILRISGDGIDRDYIRSWAAQLGVEGEWNAVNERERSAE